ncbi:hypothetical protein CL656_04635 [bacterium]|mgnify:CR=1 FL=1|nr:hypothetical protein [bacterium]
MKFINTRFQSGYEKFTPQSFLEYGKPLYIQDVAEETLNGANQNSEITGIDKYGYRLLPIVASKPGLWIHNKDDNAYVSQYLDYLTTVSGVENQIETLGIELDNQSLTQAALNNLQQIEEYNCESIIPFIMSESSELIADLLNLACFERNSNSEKLNNKGLFLEMCKVKGVKTPYGSTYKTPEQAWDLYKELENKGAIAFYSKLSRSASGQGIRQFHYENPNTQENFKSYLTNQDTISNMEQYGIRMDEAIMFDQSPAIVFWMCPRTGIQVVNSNYQVLAKKNESDLNPTIHKGAMGPLTYHELQDLDYTIQKTEEILKENHCYGPGSIDLISRKNPLTRTSEHFVVEMNKRITGGYHNYLAQKFGFSYFRSDCNMHCPSHVSFNSLISYLDQNNLLWTESKNSGTFVINYQTAPVYEKIAIISLGQSKEEAQEVYNQTQELISKL